MKKIMLTALMGILALGASAQMLTSRTYTKAKNPTLWYARAGASFNNIAGLSSIEFDADGEKVSLGTKTGFVVDFGFQKAIGKSGLYWGMELGLGNRGFAVTEKIDESEIKASLLAWNLTYSPFTIGYKYSVTDKIKIDAHFGGYLSYDFAHSLSGKVDGHKIDDIDWDEFKDDSGYEDFDGGIQLGIGMWYDRFNIDVTWQRGFGTMVNEIDGESTKTGCSSNLMLRLGIAF